MSKTADCNYYLGTAGMSFVCQDPYTGCWMPLLSPSWSDFQCWAPQIPCNPGWDQSRDSHKASCNAGRNADCPFWILFPTGGARVSRGTSPHVLCWPGEGTMWSMCTCSSNPSNTICFGLCCTERCSSLTPMPLDSCSGVLFLNSQLLFVLLVSGSNVRSNIYHHLGDITPERTF